MQFIRDIYAARRAGGRPVISFEFFPPKTDEGDRNLLEKTLPALLQTRPDYCSVTYGAGGSTRDRTVEVVTRIQEELGTTTMAHLTCVGSTRQQVQEIIEQETDLGELYEIDQNQDGQFEEVIYHYPDQQIEPDVALESNLIYSPAAFPEQPDETHRKSEMAIHD